MITVPKEVSSDIKAFTKHLIKGFLSVKVTATIGKITWKSSLVPDNKMGCYFLPPKVSLRKDEGIGKDDNVFVSLCIKT